MGAGGAALAVTLRPRDRRAGRNAAARSPAGARVTLVKAPLLLVAQVRGA